jgi:DNA-binding response OmpR family regulator
VLVLLLAHGGHEAYPVTDAAQRVVLLENLAPPAAVLDIGLPGMNGLELAHRIHELKGLRIRLIALTGYIDSIIPRRKLLDAGFDEVLRKPVDFQTLLPAVMASNPDRSNR